MFSLEEISRLMKSGFIFDVGSKHISAEIRFKIEGNYLEIEILANEN